MKFLALTLFVLLAACSLQLAHCDISSLKVGMPKQQIVDLCGVPRYINYTSTGYVAVLGAHGNTEHWLTRLYEHGTDSKKTTLGAGTSIANSKLVTNVSYKVELSRTDGRTLQFIVDGVVVHAFEDAQPLQGPGHDHFAFNGWEPPACFDNLVVTPL